MTLRTLLGSFAAAKAIRQVVKVGTQISEASQADTGARPMSVFQQRAVLPPDLQALTQRVEQRTAQIGRLQRRLRRCCAALEDDLLALALHRDTNSPSGDDSTSATPNTRASRANSVSDGSV